MQLVDDTATHTLNEVGAVLNVAHEKLRRSRGVLAAKKHRSRLLGVCLYKLGKALGLKRPLRLVDVNATDSLLHLWEGVKKRLVLGHPALYVLGLKASVHVARSTSKISDRIPHEELSRLHVAAERLGKALHRLGA